MYVVPFSMGPVGSPLAKVGVQLTDSPYVAASMRIMTHMNPAVLASLYKPTATFIKCLHSVGAPLPLKGPPLPLLPLPLALTSRASLAEPLVSNWPCNPSMTLVAHLPHRNEIVSFGSGYGGTPDPLLSCSAIG